MPSASLDLPVETSIISFSRCSEMLLAGSETGKSEGFEVSGGDFSICMTSFSACSPAAAMVYVQSFES